MEAATVINDEPGLGSEEEVETPVEESRPAIFKHTAYINLPQDCAGCDNSEHFHAWVKLPNKFQHKEIREHALAARARRLRVLRDLDSDTRLIMEDELDLLLGVDKATLVEEIINQDSGKDMLEAIKDVAEIEDENAVSAEGETTLLYAHIEDDETRLAELDLLPEEERPTEEHEGLTRHIHAYYMAIDDRAREIQEPERTALMDKDMEGLVDLVRNFRIDQEGMDTFLHAYNSWMIVYGTMLADRSGRKFKTLDGLKDQAPEVVDALVEAFGDLEQGAKAGNS